MNKSKRGRPPNTERQNRGDLLWLEERLAVAKAEMRQRGIKPKKALARAAADLDMSERKAFRLRAQIKQQNDLIALRVASFGVFLRELGVSPED